MRQLVIPHLLTLREAITGIYPHMLKSPLTGRLIMRRESRVWPLMLMAATPVGAATRTRWSRRSPKQWDFPVPAVPDTISLSGVGWSTSNNYKENGYIHQMQQTLADMDYVIIDEMSNAGSLLVKLTSVYIRCPPIEQMRCLEGAPAYSLETLDGYLQ